jgi:hypothetical protein
VHARSVHKHITIYNRGGPSYACVGIPHFVTAGWTPHTMDKVLCTDRNDAEECYLCAHGVGRTCGDCGGGGKACGALSGSGRVGGWMGGWVGGWGLLLDALNNNKTA